MERLLELLKDGHARSVEMLAIELNTTSDDIRRQLEYLENIRIIRRIPLNISCASCSGGEDGKTCPGCIPENGFQNMGEMWEVISN